eukprot:SAG11_NODE_851_length_6875_cov_8.193034_2_plen_49_part_00
MDCSVVRLAVSLLVEPISVRESLRCDTVVGGSTRLLRTCVTARCTLRL